MIEESEFDKLARFLLHQCGTKIIKVTKKNERVREIRRFDWKETKQNEKLEGNEARRGWYLLDTRIR